MACGLTIGLTGGIGSGKSTVSARFSEKQVAVFDTDIIARELVAPGQPALTEIIDLFGHEFQLSDGGLDRVKLRETVFSHSSRRQQLERILHPRIRSSVLQACRESDSDYCVICVPLLLETDFKDLVDRILVVDVPEELQVRRGSTRDHQSEEQIRQVMQTQLGRQERLALADDIIDNSHDLTSLYQQVDALHEKYSRQCALHQVQGTI